MDDQTNLITKYFVNDQEVLKKNMRLKYKNGNKVMVHLISTDIDALNEESNMMDNNNSKFSKMKKFHTNFINYNIHFHLYDYINIT